jgi:colicin import membrane protein
LRIDWTISAVGHVAAIAIGFVTIASGKPPARDATEWVPVNIVADVTQVPLGEKDAPKPETQKPMVEKIEEPKPTEDVSAKLDKKEVKAAREAAPEPAPKPVEPKRDPIAEALTKDESKKPEVKRTESKAPTPPKKPAPPATKFDPKKVEALLDKRDSARVATAGAAPNPTPSLGTATGRAAQLSLSELDALRQRLAQLWAIPPGAKDPQELVVVFRIRLKPDGRLADWPLLVSGGKSALAIAAREAAARAINRGQPYDMLRPENYELWKDIEITFDPRDMGRL